METKQEVPIVECIKAEEVPKCDCEVAVTQEEPVLVIGGETETKAQDTTSLMDKFKGWVYNITNTIPEIKVGSQALPIKAESYFNGEIAEYEMTQTDKYHILVFYCKDFSTVCPKELQEFNERFEDFSLHGAEIVGISVDDIQTHKRVCESKPEEGGIGMLKYPLVSDISKTISTDYGLLSFTGLSNRATVIIDPQGTVRSVKVHSLLFARNVQEILEEFRAIVMKDDIKKNIDLNY
ncbi:peroxiredoxin, putative [Entamoeba invadens IP1]|uniref:Peroxiredoxin, putative n=1 Tax=Entamoeba invadens IP1 TaxID=370355 RepID=A0A0A1U476_ENTIV|nr:peroxiredoxin, putative [Entamoeba invadens IP1]ELP89038.1 peroxiredoxin, putative [Entamoeba invadens IP1]|eukprot:XP_004255809.1 peroxiredoxin, putative [Entamoeba invadens IP1]